MKRIIVYQSKTGFSEKYALWIAEALQCEAKPLSKKILQDLQSYDQVIYGGWLMGGMISDLAKIKKLDLKSLVVFATGMTRPSEEYTLNLAKQNELDPKTFFYFEGGYAPQKVGFVSKMMLNMIKKSVENKKDKTEEDYYSLETFKGADRTKKEAITPLVTYCKH